MKYKKKKDRKNIILITVAALALVVTTAVWLLCFTGDNQGYRTISVVDLSGNVSVVKDDIEYSAYPGMVLQEGHEIVTAANSYVRLVLDDDKYVKLEPGSKMVFDTLGVFGSNKTKLNLERGSMTSEIVKPLDSDAEYVVVAPNAVLSVRGTFFRVDLGVGEDGQINADVMTYGGSVASQRVMPTGEVVEEEVLIDAGFKTSINMDTEDTVYVMQAVDGAIDTTGDGVANLAPIVKTDIPDDDMVDIYFASENGHELFVTAEEVKEDIEERGINLEEQTSVYEKAEVILAEQQKETNQQLSMTDVSVFADDNVPLARVEEVVKEQESISEETSTSEKTSEAVSETTSANNVTQGMLTDGVGEETIIEHVHTSVMGGTEGAHRECSECGEVLSTVHSFSKKETVAATCETAGENTFTCLCGYSYTEEIEATGHTAVSGGTASAHTQCSVCNEILDAEHSY
ncbi:MAG: FecR domain-containing protein, partial [Lachnospiraceae bacterium]|nr:FecR domain-containing protein [Lachnospiraceae bacterium]